MRSWLRRRQQKMVDGCERHSVSTHPLSFSLAGEGRLEEDNSKKRAVLLPRPRLAARGQGNYPRPAWSRPDNSKKRAAPARPTPQGRPAVPADLRAGLQDE